MGGGIKYTNSQCLPYNPSGTLNKMFGWDFMVSFLFLSFWFGSQSFHPEDLPDHSLIQETASAIVGTLSKRHNSTIMLAVIEVKVETQVMRPSVGKEWLTQMLHNGFIGPAIFSYCWRRTPTDFTFSTISFHVDVNRLPGASTMCRLLFALPLLHHCMCLVDTQTEKRAREDLPISRRRQRQQPVGATADRCATSAGAAAAERKQQGGWAGAQKAHGPLLSDVWWGGGGDGRRAWARGGVRWSRGGKAASL